LKGGTPQGLKEYQSEIIVAILASTPTIRAGLRAILQSYPQFKIAAEVTNLGTINSLTGELDVLIAAVSSLGAPGELFTLLEQEGATCALLLLADDSTDLMKYSSPPLRAWGVLPLDTSEEELVATLQALHQGLVTVSPVFLNVLRPKLTYSNEEEIPTEQLTEREMQVLQLLAQGLANKQIALQLAISEHTVKFHISSVYSKLGATNRTEAVRLGVHQGLIIL
jgi:DNA-binding NarL/FixJ family response regulator